jgi:hypothetical protein
MFTTAESTAIAATPVAAARRPLFPPRTAIAPAIPIQSFERVATSDSRRSDVSSVGVGVAATAR